MRGQISGFMILIMIIMAFSMVFYTMWITHSSLKKSEIERSRCRIVEINGEDHKCNYRIHLDSSTRLECEDGIYYSNNFVLKEYCD